MYPKEIQAVVDARRAELIEEVADLRQTRRRQEQAGYRLPSTAEERFWMDTSYADRVLGKCYEIAVLITP